MSLIKLANRLEKKIATAENQKIIDAVKNLYNLYTSVSKNQVINYLQSLKTTESKDENIKFYQTYELDISIKNISDSFDNLKSSLNVFMKDVFGDKPASAQQQINDSMAIKEDIVNLSKYLEYPKNILNESAKKSKEEHPVLIKSINELMLKIKLIGDYVDIVAEALKSGMQVASFVGKPSSSASAVKPGKD